MNFKILSCAEQELIDAVDYYNEQNPGLGFKFAAEIKKTFERIEDFPEAWPLISERIRRCMTHLFPYGVLYQIQGADALILAIMHLKREPVPWQERIPDDDE